MVCNQLLLLLLLLMSKRSSRRRRSLKSVGEVHSRCLSSTRQPTVFDNHSSRRRRLIVCAGAK